MPHIFKQQLAAQICFQANITHADNLGQTFITHSNRTIISFDIGSEEINSRSHMKRSTRINHPIALLAHKIDTIIFTNDHEITIGSNCCCVFLLLVHTFVTPFLLILELSAFSLHVPFLMAIIALNVFL
ncbi:hypothetical protein CsSME_00039111 [Camellia sinensis var. sinensis]